MPHATKRQQLTESDDGAARRARFIATMHALIAWLSAHPNVPAPWSCSIGIKVPDQATLDRLVAELDGFDLCPSGDQITNFEPVQPREFYTPISIHVEEKEDRPL